MSTKTKAAKPATAKKQVKVQDMKPKKDAKAGKKWWDMKTNTGG
ncbi:MAG: hypothetical protein QOE70_599 [Chthoniobacter sp.]|jgi:hypothetical protein|nr:hypothetical protein [Chthoniobacter sp.]